MVTFDNQTDFATEAECMNYAEQKSDYVIEKLEENMVIGKIYYGCTFKGTGLKV
jgi:predicted lipoprotein